MLRSVIRQLALVGLLLLPLSLRAGETIALMHVNVVDVEAKSSDEAMRSDQTVVVRDGKIIAAGAARHVRIPCDARRVEAAGKFLIPGLYDMHVHCLFEGRPAFCFPLLVANGVTAIRDMGGAFSKDEIQKLRDEIAARRLIAPRLAAVAGRMIDAPAPPRDGFVNVASADEARNVAADARARGWDFLKAYNLLSRESYAALVSEAARQHLAVEGHVPFSMTAEEVSNLHQKSIEHLADLLISVSRDEAALRQRINVEAASAANANWARAKVEIDAAQSYDADKAAALFREFARNGTWQCPTLVLKRMSGVAEVTELAGDERLQYIPASLQERWRTTFTQLVVPTGSAYARRARATASIRLVGEMARAGVKILAGTDSPPQPFLYPGFSLHEELRLLVEGGLTPLDALRAATINPAQFLGEQQTRGSIAKGKVADLVLLRGNPLERIESTAQVEAVVLNGRYLERADLDRLLASAKQDRPPAASSSAGGYR